MNLLVRILVLALSVLITSYLLGGVSVDGMLGAIVVAVVLAILNSFVKPLMIFFTLPFTVVTFGLFLLVINACIILLADAIVPGFRVDGFWWALLFSLIVSIINALLESIARKPE